VFELLPVERPYPGLRAFEPHEAEIFFGREAHTDRLLAILQRERFLAVIGPSGSGKSSLVRAGLLPGLAMGSLGTGSDWRVALLRPGDRPMRSLAAALLQPAVLGRHLLPDERGGNSSSSPATPDDADIAALEAELRRGPLSLARVVAEAQQRHQHPDPGPDGAGPGASPPAVRPAFNLLVLVDQFEEIFTYAEAGGRQAADESEAFVSLLLAARDAAKAQAREPGLHVALTMRTDFLGNCVRFDELPEAINQAQYLTPRLKRDEIERAIRGPAELWGGSIDDSLVAELINATGQSADQLPLVQHALARMWDEAAWRAPPPPVVDWPVAEAIGGVAGAVAKHAQEIWDTLDPVEQAIVTGIFSAITERRSAEAGGQAVRRPQTLARIASWLGRPTAELAPLVERYAAADVCFLQFRAPLTDDSIVDISHEAVIRQWPALTAWVDLEADRAAGLLDYHRRTRLYRAGQTSLLAGADLVRAWEWGGFGVARTAGQAQGVVEGWAPQAAWVQRYLGDAPFTEAEAGELAESIRAASDPLTLASARLAGLQGYIQASHDAVEQAQRAEAERLEREASYQRQLAEAAQTQTQRARRQTVFFALFGVVALLLALFGGWSWQRASENAQAAVAATGKANAATAIAQQKAQEAETSASAATAAKADALAAAASQAEAAVAAEDAKRKALAAQSTAEKSQASLKLALVDATQHRMVADANAYFTGRKSATETIAMRLALAALRVKATPEAWGELQTPAGQHDEQQTLEYRAPVTAVAWSPDGRRIVSGSGDNTLRLWDARSGEPIGQPLKGHTNWVRNVAWSPDGSRIVSSSADNTLRLWDARSGEPIGQPLKGHTNSVTSVAWSPDGSRIVSGSSDNTLRLWLSPTAWADKLCSLLTRNFSPEEWDHYVGSAIPYTVQCPKLPVPKWGEWPVEGTKVWR
jgi:hypothetical protein